MHGLPVSMGSLFVFPRCGITLSLFCNYPLLLPEGQALVRCVSPGGRVRTGLGNRVYLGDDVISRDRGVTEDLVRVSARRVYSVDGAAGVGADADLTGNRTEQV